MTADASILNEQDNVRGAFSRSAAFHIAVIGGLALHAYLNGPGERFGSEDAGGPAVSVTSVSNIPIPTRGPENPVAEESKSEVPQEAAKPAAKEVREPEPDEGIALLPRDKKQPLVPKSRLKSFAEIDPNQITSKSPQALSNPLLAAAPGAGLINTGGDTTLGTKFPAYAALIKQLTQAGWRVQDVDPSVRSAPLVTIQFVIQRAGGRATSIRLTRRSNVPTLDLSVQNAVEETNYPPLPDGYDKSSVPVEFTFELKR